MPCKSSSTFVYFIVSLLLALILPTIHTQDAPQYYLDAHNSARAKVGVGPMTWSEKLATYAENYASTRVADCTREYSGGPYGENLANGTRSSISGTDIINIWIAEKANYDSSSNVCIAHRSCKNYTQVVWQKSLSLGCAKVRCSEGGYFFSCNYDPKGNLNGQRPFEINESSAPTPNSNYLPPFISPSPAAKPPNFDFVPPSNYSEDSRNVIGILMGLIAGASALIILGLVFVWFFLRWKRKQKESYPVFDVSFGAEFENGTGPRKFSYRELACATNNFCEEVKLGEGGFGAVYKGFLKDLNTFVAVKKVSLVPWVWESYGNKRLVDVVDKKLGMNFDIKQMECLMIVGLCKMPVPNYDVPSSSAPAPTAMSGESWISLTVPRALGPAIKPATSLTFFLLFLEFGVTTSGLREIEGGGEVEFGVMYIGVAEIEGGGEVEFGVMYIGLGEIEGGGEVEFGFMYIGVGEMEGGGEVEYGVLYLGLGEIVKLRTLITFCT
ncbi:hypothetical protein QYF36_000983 [Acer negundo]|nr:hypothetical protein QYF36_000983 [Acer negundo]